MTASFTCRCLLLAALAISANASEFHVSPQGSDSNPGTAAKPFATLEKARDAARREKGSTIELATGTYRVTGSVAVPQSAVKTVTDPAVLERLLPEVRSKVMEIAIPSFRPEDFGEVG